MVGCGNRDRVNPRAELVKQFAVVEVFLRFFVLLRLGVQALCINVANRDNSPVVGRVLRVTSSFTADTDAGNVQRVVRPDSTCPAMPALG